MKKAIIPLLAAITLMSFPACAQRSTTSDYSYRKAVDAFYEDKDPDKALRDVTYAIKNYKGKPSVYKSTLYGLRGAIYADMDRDADAAKDYQMAAASSACGPSS